MKPIRLNSILALLALSPLLAAADKVKPEAPKSPIEVTLEGTAKYTLDLGGMTADEFQKALKDEKKNFAPLKVELKLVIKNTSDKAIQIWESGDPVTIDFKLTGKGVATLKPLLAVTADFKLPKAVELAPGKTIERPIKALGGGFRGIGLYSYWTLPGDYELTATFNTGISPVPEGSKDEGEGFGKVAVTSKALKVTVEEKK